MSHCCQSAIAFHSRALTADNASMHQRDRQEANKLADSIDQLCRHAAQSNPALIKDDGTPNHNRIAEDIQERTGKKFSQSTLTRILNGQVANPSSETLKTLSGYFGVSIAVLRKEEAMPSAKGRNTGPWPFSFDRSRFDRLNKEQKLEIQGAVLRLILEYEDQRGIGGFRRTGG